ncbi:hypothetical protein V9L05_15220 [Bernardetia sp. Wsw4-3y2]|uniref:hypothetical protein n=1 Tax=Bernardetia sp. Wsw4-3y2 TaxID=3127471 RepID=UPI0030D3C58F
MAAATISLAAIKAEFGAYYLGNSENMKRLHTLAYFQSKTDKLFSYKTTEATVYQTTLSKYMGKRLQTFQKTWTPHPTTIEFIPHTIPLGHLKFDLDVFPDDLEKSWLDFLKGKDLKPINYPFIRWLVEDHILAGWEEEWELEAVYKGVFAAPTPGTPNQPNEVVNGIRKVINDHITSGRITPFALGAIPASNADFVKYMIQFADMLPSKYRNNPFTVQMSDENSLRYMRGMDDLNLYYNKESNLAKIPKTNITVVGLESMSGDDKIWMSFKENMLLLEKDIKKKDPQLETAKREVSVLFDYWKAPGFEVPELVFTNDLELV